MKNRLTANDKCLEEDEKTADEEFQWAEGLLKPYPLQH